MGRMTLADYRQGVLRALYNVSSSHPVIDDGVDVRAINNGVNRMIRENPDLFPEHNNRSFTMGPLSLSTSLLPIPALLLILQRVTRDDDEVRSTTGDTTDGSDIITNCADTSEFEVGDFVNVSDGFVTAYQIITALTSTTITVNDVAISDNVAVTVNSDPGDWSGAQELPVSPSSERTIEYADKTTDGFPQLYVRKGNNLLYYPTTHDGYSCYLRLHGVSGEDYITADGDTFRINEHFDQAVVFYAASEVAETLDWYDRAERLLSMGKQRLETVSVRGSERAMKGIQFGSAGGFPR